MIRNFDKILSDLNGNPLGNEKQGDLIVSALLRTYTDEHADGVENLKRGILARKIHKGGDIDLNVDELALIKRLVEKHCTPLCLPEIIDAIETDSP